LPVGSVIQIDSLPNKYNGVYTIMDTGPMVQGRHIDLYMWSCYEALDFGRRPLRLTVLRLGWSPQASTPSVVDPLFREREAERERQLQASPTGAGPEPATGPTPPSKPRGGIS
jgi:rare lipoprotein A (peptidoglycan hydrolase)